MERRSTKNLLNGLREGYENFDASEWCDGTTPEKLHAEYNEYKEIAETLSIVELRLIATLRKCRQGETKRFLNAAQSLCNAIRICAELDKAPPLEPPQ